MSRRRSFKSAGNKREPGHFSAWPEVCARHKNYYRLSAQAKVLLFELLTQYRGNNNGDLTCAWGVLCERGWRARSTLQKAEKELLSTGWIVRTRQGGRNSCNLYALTFFDVDDCGGKLDTGAPIGKRLSWWRQGGPPEAKKDRDLKADATDTAASTSHAKADAEAL